MERLAWAVALLLRPYSKRPITPDMLLGRRREMNRDERAAAFSSVWAKVEQGREKAAGEGVDG